MVTLYEHHGWRWLTLHVNIVVLMMHNYNNVWFVVCVPACIMEALSDSCGVNVEWNHIYDWNFASCVNGWYKSNNVIDMQTRKMNAIFSFRIMYLFPRAWSMWGCECGLFTVPYPCLSNCFNDLIVVSIDSLIQSLTFVRQSRSSFKWSTWALWIMNGLNLLSGSNNNCLFRK